MQISEQISQFISTLIGKSKNTKKVYLHVIKNFLEFVNKDEISQYDVIRYLNMLDSNDCKSSTIRLHAVVLKKFLNFIGKDTSKIKLPRIGKDLKNIYVKSEYIKDFLNAFDSFRDKLIVRFILLTGCRVGEVANLMIEDVDFKNRIVKIVDHGKYEIKKQRIIPIDKVTCEMLKQYIGDRKSGSVFNLGVRAIQKIIKKGALRSKIPNCEKITPHKLRHTMAINWITKGGDLRTLQRILGHNSIKTTEVYLDYDIQDMIRVYDRMSDKLL
jgi:Site-specific recombinase XerD